MFNLIIKAFIGKDWLSGTKFFKKGIYSVTMLCYTGCKGGVINGRGTDFKKRAA